MALTSNGFEAMKHVNLSETNMKPTSENYMINQFRYVAGALKVLRFIFSAFGVIAIPVGQIWQTSATPWQQNSADYIFWGGVVSIMIVGLVLSFFERDAVSITLQLRRTEQTVAEQTKHIDYMRWREDMLLAWQAVTKLLLELADQTLTADPLTKEKRGFIFTAIVEILADYKFSLFRINDEYCNISLYRKNGDELLECVACYRSRPSDATVVHRKWAVGEGHVGKAFELQRELICANSNSPDVKPWIAAPPGKLDERDEERYVSLAAMPVAVNAEEPLGVLIITSSEPMRFANSDEVNGDDDAREQRRLSVAAIQDFAAIVGQIMLIMEMRNNNSTEDEAGG